MSRCKLFSLTLLAVLLLLGGLTKLTGLAKAAPAPNRETKQLVKRIDFNSFSAPQANLPAKPAAMLPPLTPFERPLLQNTPALTITKSALPEVNAGETLTYTIVVANGAITEATNTIITDVLDNHVAFAWASDSGLYDSGAVTWNTNTISGEQTITRTLLVTVSAGATAGTIITNTVEVTSAEGISDSHTLTTTVNTQADLILTKTDFSDSVIAGQNLTYTLTITNNGPSDAQNVVVTDTLPLSVTVLSTFPSTSTQNGRNLGWNFDSLPSGASQIITLAVKVGGDVRGTINNTATVTSTTTDPTPGNNTDAESTMVEAEIDLVLTKTDSPDPVPTETSLLKYVLTITNGGPSDATGVVLTDTLPAGVRFEDASHLGCNYSLSNNRVVCNLGALNKDDSPKVITITITPLQKGILTNQATVSANETDLNPANNTDDENTTVHPVNLSITKSDWPDPALVGYPLTYTLNITNEGPNIATGLTLIDTLPPNVTFQYATGSASCAVMGITVTCSLPNLSSSSGQNTTWVKITVIPSPTAAGLITNTAQVTADEPDLNPANNTDTETTTVLPVADLEISKSASPNPVIAGESLTYTLVITNNGPSTATGIVLTDTLANDLTFISGSNCGAAGNVVTCSLNSLTKDGTNTFNIKVSVAPSKRGSLANSAQVTGNEFDPTTANNTSNTVITTVDASANLSIGKSAAPNPVTAGETLTYTLTVTNSGPSDVMTSLVVTDTLPSGVTFISGAGCSSNAPGTVVTCTRAGLLSGHNTVISFKVNVDPAKTGSLSNQASVAASEPDPVTSNNTSNTTVTTVNTRADLALTKSGPPTLTAGELLTYTLTVVNNGPSNALGVVVTDTLPTDSHLVYKSTACNLGGNKVICNLGGLVRNNTATATIVITSTITDTPTVNSAEVRSSTTDPTTGNNTSTVTTTLTTPADDVSRVYLPIIIKPVPTDLYIENDTGGQATFTVQGVGSCTVPAGHQNFYCLSFPPGTYTVQAATICGTGTSVKTYGSGYQSTRIACGN